MSLAEQLRKQSQSPKYPNSGEQVSVEVAEIVLRKNLKRRLNTIRRDLEFEAECGNRECVISVGILGETATPLRFREYTSFLTREGFSFEESTAHFRAESRGEFKVEQHLIVKW